MAFTYLLHLFPPRSTVLLEKLTVSLPVKKFPACYGTQRFITTFTSAGHLSLSSASLNPIHTPISHFLKRTLNYYPPICAWVSQIVSSHPVSPPKHCMCLFSPHTCYMPHPSHFFWMYHLNNNGWRLHIMKILIMQFSPFPCYLVPLRPDSLFSNTLGQVPPSMWVTKFHTHTKQQAQ